MIHAFVYVFILDTPSLHPSHAASPDVPENVVIQNVPELCVCVVFVKIHMTACRLTTNTNAAKALAAFIFRVEPPLKWSQPAHQKVVI